MTRTILSICMATAILALPTAAEARHRHHHHVHHRELSRESRTIASQSAEIARLRTGQRALLREFEAFRRRIGPAVPFAALFAPQQTLAALSPPAPFPDMTEPASEPSEPTGPSTASLPILTTGREVPNAPRHSAYRVFPCTCTQRGQWGDRRRTHIHAGIDMGGEYGSAIVAAIGGVVLHPPGGDTGYGPHAMVIRGHDGNVYRYAHMRRVIVHPGDKVTTGQKIGEMGHRGARGFTHLHFEIIAGREYRGRPYGFHRSLDPNALLGGKRGSRMAGGETMRGKGATATAEAK